MSFHAYILSVPVDFAIAHSRIRFSHHVLIHLVSDEHEGWGEGVLYRSLPLQVAALFETVAEACTAHAASTVTMLDVARGELPSIAAAAPALAYALDTALLDVQTRSAGQPLTHALGGRFRDTVPVTEQLFLQNPESAKAELAAITRRGTRRLKVKIGSSPRIDVESIAHIRRVVGDDVEIRVDANRAYTLAEGEALYRTLADLGVLALEEPLRTADWADLKALRQRVGLPVILDESILTLANLRAAIAAEAIDILNLKLTRAGGISLALDYVSLCQEHGVQVALGCTEELGIGTSAIVHLAAALPTLHSVEGVGPLRLGFDLAQPAWEVQDGSLPVPSRPGLGVAPHPDWRQELPDHVRCFPVQGSRLRLNAYSHYARWTQRADNVIWRLQRRRRR